VKWARLGLGKSHAKIQNRK